MSELFLSFISNLSGLRRGEQFAQRRKDVDLIEGTVTVERAQIVLKNQPLIYGEPKSEAGNRTVALPRFLVTNLIEHLNLYSSPIPLKSVDVNYKANTSHTISRN